MTKEVMVLEIRQQLGGFENLQAVMWFGVPAGKEIPNAGFMSAWKDIATKDGALLTQLRAGQIVEEVYSFQVPTALTTAQLQVFLQAAWTSRNTYLVSTAAPGQFYGFFWDGTAWVQA